MRPRFHRNSSVFPVVLFLAASMSAAFEHTEISSSVAQQMIASGQDLIVLDVREYSEFCGSYEHIEDAVNLPWSSDVLEARFEEVPADATIIVVCASGGRSHLASTFLDDEGYSDVYDMEGGMSGWEFETEACDTNPVLLLHKDGPEVEINWTPVDGRQDYDLLRGLLSNIADGGTIVDLGPTDCLAKESPYTYYPDTETPLSGSVHFYLARQVDGSWGRSSQGQPRIPQFCD